MKYPDIYLPIQEHLALWEEILKPEVFAKLKTYAESTNYKAKDGHGINRGHDLDSFVQNLMCESRNAKIKKIMNIKVLKDTPFDKAGTIITALAFFNKYHYYATVEENSESLIHNLLKDPNCPAHDWFEFDVKEIKQIKQTLPDVIIIESMLYKKNEKGTYDKYLVGVNMEPINLLGDVTVRDVTERFNQAKFKRTIVYATEHEKETYLMKATKNKTPEEVLDDLLRNVPIRRYYIVNGKRMYVWSLQVVDGITHATTDKGKRIKVDTIEVCEDQKFHRITVKR